MPRLLPVLGQVWADFKMNDTESVQKQILPTESPSPENLQHLPAQHPERQLRRPTDPLGPQVRPELSSSQSPASVSG